MPAIRPAEVDDVDGIQRVARRTWHATYDETLGPATVDAQVDEWYADAAVRDGVEDDEAIYLVATAEDAVVGYAAAGPGEAAADCASLHAIYVHPDHWHDGIGSRLLDVVSDRLRRRGFDCLRIHVLADNDRARRFYEHHGFTQSERQRIELAGVTTTEVVYDGPLPTDSA